jgi:hypothetical protein
VVFLKNQYLKKKLTVPRGVVEMWDCWEDWFRSQCLNWLHRTKKRLANDSDSKVVIQRDFLFESCLRRALFLLQVWNCLWVRAQESLHQGAHSRCPLLSTATVQCQYITNLKCCYGSHWDLFTPWGRNQSKMNRILPIALHSISALSCTTADLQLKQAPLRL